MEVLESISSKDKPFQWVQHNELELHIAARAAKMGLRKQPKKVSLSERRVRDVALAPSQVQVAPGSFSDPDGLALSAVL